MLKNQSYHNKLKLLMDSYANNIYDYTASFPKSEMFGLTSQLRRSGLSVVLNYIEGYARQRKKVLRNFLEIAYGSLKESKYLIYFSYKRNYLEKGNYDELIKLSEEIGAMLWGTIKSIKK